MTLYQFKFLDEAEQQETLWEMGVHIAERDEGEWRLILYQIEAFYVEVWYHREDNYILKFRSFLSTEQLEPYLSKVDIRP